MTIIAFINFLLADVDIPLYFWANKRRLAIFTVYFYVIAGFGIVETFIDVL